VLVRDDSTCHVWGFRPEGIPGADYDGRYTVGHLELDHIKPRRAGGALCDIKNAQTLCGGCNARKGGNDGQTS
jgi:5-methylcytosine-specific restriction endonuclease McrA